MKEPDEAVQGNELVPNKAVDPDKVAAKKETQRKRKEAREANKKLIKDYLNEKKIQFPREVADALNVLLKTGSSKVRTTSAASAVLAKLKSERQVDETDLFMEFKVARKEMGSYIRNWIKKPAPNNRTWVRFDKESEHYVLAGEGENPPEGWTGYVPTEDEF